MEEAGFMEFVCLNHDKNERIRAVETKKGTIFVKTREEAFIKSGKGVGKYPLSRLALLDLPVGEVSVAMRHFLKTMKSKRHAIIVVF